MVRDSALRETAVSSSIKPESLAFQKCQIPHMVFLPIGSADGITGDADFFKEQLQGMGIAAADGQLIPKCADGSLRVIGHMLSVSVIPAVVLNGMD